MPWNENSISDSVSGIPNLDRCMWWICQRPSSKVSTIRRGPPERLVTMTLLPTTCNASVSAIKPNLRALSERSIHSWNEAATRSQGRIE